MSRLAGEPHDRARALSRIAASASLFFSCNVGLCEKFSIQHNDKPTCKFISLQLSHSVGLVILHLDVDLDLLVPCTCIMG